MHDQPILGRSQTQAEREKLIKVCRALGLHDSLCKVITDYSTKDGKFVLKKGDIIRERYQKSNHSLVENGLATYSVPTNIYRKIQNPFSPDLINPASSGDNDEGINEQNIIKSLNQQKKVEEKSDGGVRFRIEENQKESFGIPEKIVDHLTLEKQHPNGRESVNWLREFLVWLKMPAIWVFSEYDDKIVDLPSFEDYNRPAPAPPEALKTWTTFENDNDTPRVVVPPQAIFGSLSNPIPMEPQPLPSTVTHFPVNETTPTRRAPPPPPPGMTISPSNPFGNSDFLNLSQSLPIQYTLPKPSSRYSEPDPLSNLVKEEIEKTRRSLVNTRNQCVSPHLPPAPSGPPPVPPKFSADSPLPLIKNGTNPPERPAHLFANARNDTSFRTDLTSIPKSQASQPNNEKVSCNNLKKFQLYYVFLA